MFSILETNFNRALKGKVEQFPLGKIYCTSIRDSANINHKGDDQAISQATSGCPDIFENAMLLE